MGSQNLIESFAHYYQSRSTLNRSWNTENFTIVSIKTFWLRLKRRQNFNV